MKCSIVFALCAGVCLACGIGCGKKSGKDTSGQVPGEGKLSPDYSPNPERPLPKNVPRKVFHTNK